LVRIGIDDCRLTIDDYVRNYGIQGDSQGWF
jgi:hypothetical protein